MSKLRDEKVKKDKKKVVPQPETTDHRPPTIPGYPPKKDE